MTAGVHTTPWLRMEADLLGAQRFVLDAAPIIPPRTPEQIAHVEAAAARLVQQLAPRSVPAAPLKARPLADADLLAAYRAIIGAEQSACDAWDAYAERLGEWRRDGGTGRAPREPLLPVPSIAARAAAVRVRMLESKLEGADAA